MYNAPYAGVANELAKFGRYGDSELVHLNPIEVQMLASLSPTGQLTINPMTGQKEAFLPFLAPLLGSFLGSSLLTGTGAALLGGAGLSSAAAGAIGSGLATAAVTGDLEQGILSGLTGFGLGQAFGAAGDVAAKAGTEAATSGVTQGLTDATMQGVQSITPDALNIQPLSAGTVQGFPTSSMANASMQSFLPISQQADLLSQGLTAPATQAATEPTRTAANLTAGQRMAAPFTQSGTFLSELASPGSFLPMYVGETGRMAREQELMGRGSMAEYEKEQEAARQKTLRQMGDVFNRVRQAYPGVGYAKGGQVERYYDGGSIEEQVRQAMMDQYQASALPVAEDVQLSLRGAQFVPPPASSYSALDVGGEGYLAGVAPEFQYFREPPPPPPAAIAPPPPGSIAGDGGYDIENILKNFGAYRNYVSGQEDTTIRDTAEDLLSKQFAPFQERLGRIESRLEQPVVQEFDYSRIPSYTPPDLSLIEERLAAIESKPVPTYTAPEFDYSRIPSYTPPDFSAINERLAAIESRKIPEFDYSRIPSYTPPDLSGLENRLGGLESRISNLPAPQVNVPAVDLSPIQSQIQQLQSGIGALQSRPQPTFDTSALEQRLAAIEGRGAPQVSFDPIMERLAALEGMLASQRSSTPSYENPFSQEINSTYDYGFAEGGMTEPSGDGMDDNSGIVEMTVAAIRGEVENADQIISRFIEMYGPDVFMQLRERVLQDIVPGAQTNGMVEGEGGGQDDLVEGMIGTQRPVAVSPGEYIIPADVVALAGGGYSGDGAKYFDGLIEDIRMKTMGKTDQVKPYR